MNKSIEKRTCFLLIFLFLLTAPSFAYAQDNAPPAQLDLHLENKNIKINQGQKAEIGFAIKPVSIETGIDCGMPDMCGIDPCLCGSADSWGSCSCNGLKKTLPTVKATAADANALNVDVQNGKVLVRGIKPGVSTVTVTASLVHFADVSQVVTVQVLAKRNKEWALAAVVFLALIFMSFLYKMFFLHKREKK